ncbi:NAD(P)H-dependent glycerol-3-phosphate dehydrogenase, partial [Dietzia sp.]|uniref:NAD(P)H-dependent glycerol-3-phosphate dehydrogenase n=1 Tax=Dietzia sp. TaxID=1871616 RepID=UPI002FD9C829
AKGVETATLRRGSQIIVDEGAIPEDQVAVLSGPNLAAEIAEGQFAATVIACSDERRAEQMQGVFATGYLRPYTNGDVVGCEIAGAAKNVIALVCGIAAGLGMGYNTSATLITRGLAEITRLGVALGAEQPTFSGLAGIGDLVATCSSSLSRNRRFGEQLGRGRTMEEAQEATNGQVAEGVKSCTSIKALADAAGVEMPLTEAAHLVCHEGVAVSDLVRTLMDRSKKSE